MNNPFRFGAWLVNPATNSIETAHEKRQMEPRTMALLLALCNARGGIVSGDDLLTQCWGSTLTGDSALHKNIAQLRRFLGDSASAPQYIETLRLRGYRTVAPLDFSAVLTNGRKRWHGGSSFRGLLAFDEAHADVFFGRDESIRHLADAAAAQVRSGLALMLGPSGSGKSLQELYRLRTDGGELGFATFYRLGGLEGAIGQRAEQVVLALDDAQRATLAHIMSLLIVPSPDGANFSK